ncbi:hypothetical protein [Pseudomonas mandelii]
MPDGKSLSTYIFSAAALLGPLAYILFAFHEQGRLSYFGAPVDFMQISSFGIVPVITTIYPWMIVTFLVFSFLSGVRFSVPGQKVVLIAGAVTYISICLFYVSLTPVWKWMFGVIGGVGAIVAISKNNHVPGFGNEAIKAEPEPQHMYLRHIASVKLYFFALAGIAIFVMFFSALGKREAAAQQFYWILNDGVVLGFYGDQVLIGDRNGYEVGPRFRFVELKSIQGSLNLLRVGPLKPVPMWKAEPLEN